MRTMRRGNGLVWCAVLGGLLVGLAGCSQAPAPRVAEHVDLPRYMGTWYEIARLPVWFERGCVGSTAEYTLREDGKVAVRNACRVGTLEGKRKEARGVARVVDPKTNAKLKVWFVWPFEGDYWILRLDPNYRWAAVGSPDRKTLWILSRTPQMDEATYGQVVRSLAEEGFKTDRLERPPQAGG